MRYDREVSKQKRSTNNGIEKSGPQYDATWGSKHHRCSLHHHSPPHKLPMLSRQQVEVQRSSLGLIETWELDVDTSFATLMSRLSRSFSSACRRLMSSMLNVGLLCAETFQKSIGMAGRLLRRKDRSVFCILDAPTILERGPAKMKLLAAKLNHGVPEL
jgi:hypothetical protein